jgi:hypothetical protein
VLGTSVFRVQLFHQVSCFVFSLFSRLVSLSPEGVELFSCSHFVCVCIYNVLNQIVCCCSSGLVVNTDDVHDVVARLPIYVDVVLISRFFKTRFILVVGLQFSQDIIF